MQYTIKKLAKISGISVRTLHWYDKIGLLKPAFYQTNGYRVYEEEQLLRLQQILFFRELDFSLDDVQRLLDSNDFDKIDTLQLHKQALAQNLDRNKTLLLTIDKTIAHLHGEINMQDNELYAGFDKNKEDFYAGFQPKYLGLIAEDMAIANVARNIPIGSEEAKQMQQAGTKIFNALQECLQNGLGPKDLKVQGYIAEHVNFLQKHQSVTKDIYLIHAQLYCEHPDFVKHFNAVHPGFAAFIAEAMRIYAYTKW